MSVESLSTLLFEIEGAVARFHELDHEAIGAREQVLTQAAELLRLALARIERDHRVPTAEHLEHQRRLQVAVAAILAESQALDAQARGDRQRN